MRDISLHLSDIVQNSITAGAGLVEIGFTLDDKRVLTVSVRDDGCGMDEALLKQIEREVHIYNAMHHGNK